MNISYNDTGVTVDGVHTPCANPRLEFARALQKTPDDTRFKHLHESWILDNTVFEGRHRIGINCVIGSQGFGYIKMEDGSLFSMPHRGYVKIGNEVIIHNNTCIDRGVTGATTIGDHTRVDNLCHIAHNAVIGKYNTIAAHCSIEGSVVIGDNNTFGSGVIVQRKVKIGSNCIFGSGTIVTKNVEDNCVMVGNPAKLLRKNESNSN